MFNADSLLKRLNKISIEHPSYYLSGQYSPVSYRAQNSITNFDNLQKNIRKLACQKIKNKASRTKSVLKVSSSRAKKHPYLDVVKNFHRKTSRPGFNQESPVNLALNTSKLNIIRPQSQRSSSKNARIRTNSFRTKSINVNIPYVLYN